jgi:RNA polymerase sigma factor (sigma-70 family)
MVEYEQYSGNDFKLWQAFKSGDEQAFDFMYDTYFAKLYGYGTRFSPDKCLVKDCIQNLFVELWKNRTSLSDVTYIKNYLYKSLRRKVIQQQNQEMRYIHPDELEDNYHFEVNLSHELFLINDQIARENHTKLIEAFHSLTKRQKEAIFLRFYENLEYAEIAEIMSLKEVKYARTLIYRALEEMKGSIRNLASI